MTKIVMQKMGKIVAVSVMSAIVSVSFNGCGFLESVGNQTLSSLSSTAQKGISSLGDTAEKGISNALSSESKSSSGKSQAKSANDENDSSKCSGNEIKTDESIEKGECKNGKRNGVWKYYDINGYIQKEITFQNGEITLEKVYNEHENLKYVASYNKGEIFKRNYYNLGSLNALSSFTHSKAYFERNYNVDNLNKKRDELKKQAQEISRQRAESKVKKPTMQEVKKSKSVMDTYRANLQAQEEKELKSLLSSIIDFNTSSDEQIIAFINSNNIKPSSETITDGNLKININRYYVTGVLYGGVEFYIRDNRVGGLLSWSSDSCSDSTANNDYKTKYNCRTFAREFKELIDKSTFKDEIYNVLPKPKNQ